MSFQSRTSGLSNLAPTRFARVRPAAHAEGDPFELAAAVLGELRYRGIPPTPANYDLWFTFRSGANPALAARLAALIDAEKGFPPDLLAGLHDEFLAGVDADTVGGTAGELQKTAEAIAGQVAASGDAMRDYVDVLAAASAGLGAHRAAGGTIDGLVQAVATLTAETTRAADRNRTLQQQLTASAQRVNKLRQTLATMKQEATTDPLTGIINRKAFEARLRRGITAAKAEPDVVSLSVLLLDIDHFKRFNDTHGHKIGDLVLRLVGRVLADNVKGRDTAARYGGEEFAILLAGADLRAAETVAEQIGAALSGKELTVRQQGNPLGRITASIGVAQFRTGDGLTALMERADMALYRAKQTGRNRVCTERDLVHAPA